MNSSTPCWWNAWRDAGPRRVRRALAERSWRLGEQGLLSVGDPDLAAAHFLALTRVADPAGELPLGTADQGEIDRVAAAAARAFLHGYASS